MTGHRLRNLGFAIIWIACGFVASGTMRAELRHDFDGNYWCGKSEVTREARLNAGTAAVFGLGGPGSLLFTAVYSGLFTDGVENMASPQFWKPEPKCLPDS